MKQTIRWHRFQDPESLAREVAGLVQASAGTAIRDRGLFHLVLAGGSTPGLLYRHLNSQKPDLEHWRFYLGDERCLPCGHTDRNDHQVLESWPQLRRLRPQQFRRIPAELGPDTGAALYARVIDQVETFDLVLLGIGEDGHTASLFPGHNIGEGISSPSVLPVRHAPKPPPSRVSLSASRLSQARQTFFLVTGKGKRSAVSEWIQGTDLPVCHICPTGGVDIFTDQAPKPKQRRDCE